MFNLGLGNSWFEHRNVNPNFLRTRCVQVPEDRLDEYKQIIEKYFQDLHAKIDESAAERHQSIAHNQAKVLAALR